MDISINIQSYKRCGEVDTMGIVNRGKIWVHDFEAKDYEQEYGKKRIRRLPDGLRNNLPKVKNHILESEFESGGVDGVLLLDDDIKSFQRWEKNKRIEVGVEEMMVLIEKYSLLCKEWGMGLWGVQVNSDKQCYREYTPFSTLSYVSSSFSCFMKGKTLLYDGRLPLKEDYDMTIQQINLYRGVLRVNGVYYIKKAISPGGCSVYRNMEVEQRQIELLQRKWGDEVVRFDKNDRSHSKGKKKTVLMDINPIIKVPISGI